MENTLRCLILFVWSVLFGFFSWTTFLDDTMASSNKLMIMGGLFLALGAYVAIEFYTRKTNAPSPLKKVQLPVSQADDRILRRLQASVQDGGSAEPARPLQPRPTTVPSSKN